MPAIFLLLWVIIFAPTNICMSTIMCYNTAQAIHTLPTIPLRYRVTRPTPKVILAMQNERMSLFARLIRGGADVNAQDDEGNTALHFAMNVGYHKASALLIMRGANPHTANHEDVTPQQIAQEAGDEVLLELVQKAQHQPRDAERDQLDTSLQRAQAADSNHGEHQTDAELERG